MFPGVPFCTHLCVLGLCLLCVSLKGNTVYPAEHTTTMYLGYVQNSLLLCVGCPLIAIAPWPCLSYQAASSNASFVAAENGTLQHPPLMHEYQRYFYNAIWAILLVLLVVVCQAVRMIMPLYITPCYRYDRRCVKESALQRQWERAARHYETLQDIMDQCRELSEAPLAAEQHDDDDSRNPKPPGANPWLQSKTLAKTLGLNGSGLPFELGNPLASRMPHPVSQLINAEWDKVAVEEMPFLARIKFRIYIQTYNFSRPELLAHSGKCRSACS